MFKNKKLASALLLTTFVAASVATTALAAGSAEPPQIPGYDRNGNTVPIANPNRPKPRISLRGNLANWKNKAV